MNQKELNKIIDEHNNWIESNGKTGQIANFAGVRLAGADLSGMNFDWVDFRRANLEKATFERTSLHNANFEKANLKEANLKSASLFQADFDHANMNDCSLIEANLQVAILFNTKLNYANLKRANLSQAGIQNAELQHAVLEEANLQRTQISGADFKEANLKKANFKEAIIQEVNFESANLEGADLRGADLRWAKLIRSNLQSANTKGADFREADLREANFENTNMEGTNLQWANLQRANLRCSNLKNAKLLRANLCSTDIDLANFDNTNLQGVIIDKETASKLPKQIMDLYSKSFFIIGLNEDEYIINRSIEFPPEYHQAGISILNYFATVLRKKYPDQSAKVRIDQEGLKVSMVIEPLDGSREVIEQALDEFGLVITGQLSIDEYTDDKILRMELQNKLSLAEAEIKMQMRFIDYQDNEILKREAQIEKLLSIVGVAIQNPAQIRMKIPISSQSEATSESISTSNVKLELNIDQHIFLSHGNLNELKEKFPRKSEEAKSIREVQEGLDQIEKASSPEEVAKSSAMSKFRRFLENVGKAETTAGKVIKTTKDGIDIARKLAGHYNQIAQWCGLPQVPEPFVEKQIK